MLRDRAGGRAAGLAELALDRRGRRSLASLDRLHRPALANAVVLLGAYLAVAALVWGIADATMDQPRDLVAFDAPPPTAADVARRASVGPARRGRALRLPHRERTAGPRGNDRLGGCWRGSTRIHAEKPLDLILITGDMTDAGRSAEWAEFLDAIARHPELAERTLMLPGNHDVNIVDRANPARLDLPTSPGKRLRQMRTLSAMRPCRASGSVWSIATRAARRDAVARRWRRIAARSRAFADAGSAAPVAASWRRCGPTSFRWCCRPTPTTGSGIILLNSTAETHFSFTNALGLISAEQARALEPRAAQFPRRGWIVALHHHLVEYPRPAKALLGADRHRADQRQLVRAPAAAAGAAASWLMHGHRHIDWIGECGGLAIISAPSPVMEATDDMPTCFYIHTLGWSETGGSGCCARSGSPSFACRETANGPTELGRQRDPTNSTIYQSHTRASGAVGQPGDGDEQDRAQRQANNAEGGEQKDLPAL